MYSASTKTVLEKIEQNNGISLYELAIDIGYTAQQTRDHLAHLIDEGHPIRIIEPVYGEPIVIIDNDNRLTVLEDQVAYMADMLKLQYWINVLMIAAMTALTVFILL